MRELCPGNGLDDDSVDARSRRTLPKPRTKLLDGSDGTARQHLDAAVGQVARMTGDTEFPGPVACASTEVNALHAAGDEGTASDPVAQG